jgi:hypothetical protein
LNLSEVDRWPAVRLREQLRDGEPVSPEDLAGSTFAGISLGLPKWLEKLLWKKFYKVIERPADGAIRGYNQRAVQNRLDQPWEPLLRRGRPVRYGHFAVTSDERGAASIDYGDRRPAWAPMARVRDPLVRLSSSGPLVLLGVSQIALASRRLRTPTFFALRKLD